MSHYIGKESPSMSATERKKSSSAPIAVAGMLEDIIGCKWSLRVLRLVSEGIRRPGAMQRQVPGLSAKVLNERLRKLLRFEIIEREVFAEVPPRVVYGLTPMGESLLKPITAVSEWAEEHLPAITQAQQQYDAS